MPSATPERVYRFDAEKAQLWCENREVPLPPKSLQVLRHLIEQTGRPVDRAELLARAWGDVHVTDDAVRQTIRQIRRALGDTVGTPGFIETSPRRGWRFIGRAVRTGPHAWLLEPASALATIPPPADPAPTLFVGRAPESAMLVERLARAHGGARQLVLISGEAGLGKTRLVEAFLSRIAGTPDLVVARGQCVEHYGEGEAYRPVLEALERLCDAIGGSGPAATLRRYAPMWLAELPSLTEPDERASLQSQRTGATQGRMLREFGRALDELARDRTCVLWIDDLHWSDVSTLELLALIARRAERARLLVIGTYRPAEASAATRPLTAIRQDLEVHGYCHHHALPFLDADAIEDSVRPHLQADGTSGCTTDVAKFLRRRTEGNPLFMVSVMQELVACGTLVRDDAGWRIAGPLDTAQAPATVRQLLARDLDRLPRPDRDMLRTAALVGMSFSAAAVAAGIDAAIDGVERRCERLARAGRFLVQAGSESWPDGTVASRYAFIHALHREVLATDLTAARRARAHRQIGRRKESGYGDATTLHAAELARHFDEGRDHHRAIHYLTLAGDLAARRYANREAVEHLRRALQLLPELPAEVARDPLELQLRLALSAPLAALEGYAAPDLETSLRRIQEIARTLNESPEFFPVLLGLWSLHIVRADLDTACDIGARLLRLAEHDNEPIALLQAHRVLGHSLFYRGDLTGAQHHLERGLASYDASAHQPLDYAFGDDPVVLSHAYSAWALWFTGHSAPATQMAERAIAVGDALGHPPSLAFAMTYSAILHHFRRDTARAEAEAAAVIRFAHDEGMALFLALATIIHGWALADRGDVERGVAEMTGGLDACQQTGADLGRPYFLALVGEAYGRSGRIDEALALVAEAEALIARTDQRVFEPERLRVEGTLLLAKARNGRRNGRPSRAEDAEQSFRRAITTAQQQGAWALELRAALDLARMLDDAGDTRGARAALASIPQLATAHEDRDVRGARALLATLD